MNRSDGECVDFAGGPILKNADTNTAKFDPGDNIVVGIERSAARELKFDSLDLKWLLRGSSFGELMAENP